MERSIIASVLARLSLAWLLAASVTLARAQSPAPQFQIEAQDAATALSQFSTQARLQVLFDYQVVQGIRTQPVSGQLRVADALGRMLAGTGLGFRVVNDRTISIVRDPRTGAAAGTPKAARKNPATDTRGGSAGVARDTGFMGASVQATLEEITVTAEKRDQALQKSALAVTALPARVLERQQVTDLKSVTTLIPNLQIGASSTQAAYDLALRGIVSTNRTEIGDAAVAFHVDGFYSPRPQGATMLIHDADRLEALRGPQGTLFGRNANAGVINVVTAKPEPGEFFGGLDLTLGNYDLTRLKGHLNVPIGDTFALRGSAFVEKRDGYIDFLPGSNVTKSTARYDDSDRRAFRLSGQWEPSDLWTVFASAERYSDGGAGTIPVALQESSGAEARAALISSPGELDMKNDTFHLRTDWRPSTVELSYLFGYARMTRANVSDQDVGLAQDPELRALPDPPLQATYDEERRTHDSEFVSTQHELQIRPLAPERLDWIAGAFFYGRTMPSASTSTCATIAAACRAPPIRETCVIRRPSSSRIDRSRPGRDTASSPGISPTRRAAAWEGVTPRTPRKTVVASTSCARVRTPPSARAASISMASTRATFRSRRIPTRRCRCRAPAASPRITTHTWSGPR